LARIPFRLYGRVSTSKNALALVAFARNRFKPPKCCRRDKFGML
jgi:hypothetical protein